MLLYCKLRQEELQKNKKKLLAYYCFTSIWWIFPHLICVQSVPFEKLQKQKVWKMKRSICDPYFQAKLLSINGNFSRIFNNFRSLLTQSQAPQTHTGFVNVGSKMHCFTNRVFYLCNFQTVHPVQREHYFVRNIRTFRLCVTLLLNNKAHS